MCATAPNARGPSAVFRVRGGPALPPAAGCAYVAVWKQDHWFYVDDRGLETNHGPAERPTQDSADGRENA